jgi:hypothetical protein
MIMKYLFNKSVHLLLSMLLLLYAGVALAQEKEEEEFKPKIRGAIMMANSHVPHATEGGKTLAIIPTWGFDVDYFFHPHWSVALQGDVKLQSFEVEDGETMLKRSNPFAVAAVMHYHALRHWSFYMGPGYELEKTRNLFLVRAGTEYSFEITEDFEIALNLIYENKEEVYDTWTFGIAFNKKLWGKK